MINEVEPGGELDYATLINYHDGRTFRHMALTNAEIIEVVRDYQASASDDDILRCDNDNCWDLLEPCLSGNEVVLVCCNCGATMPPYRLAGFLKRNEKR